MAAADSGEDPQGQSRRGASTFRPAIKGAAFHPATGAAEGSPPHPCPVFPGRAAATPAETETGDAWSAAAVSWRHHRQERSKFQMPLMPRK